MEEEGFPVETVGSSEEALKALSDKNPSLVLLDVGLPGIDGFTTCQRIREVSQVPIIMVTGQDRDEDKVQRPLRKRGGSWGTYRRSREGLGAAIRLPFQVETGKQSLGRLGRSLISLDYSRVVPLGR